MYTAVTGKLFTTILQPNNFFKSPKVMHLVHRTLQHVRQHSAIFLQLRCHYFFYFQKKKQNRRPYVEILVILNFKKLAL